MKNLVKVLPLVVALGLVSCKKDQQPVNEEQSTEVASQTEMSEPAKISPLTNVALSESNFAFGKIKKGDHVEHIYEITNTGVNPLVISEVKPGCGCTAPDYTKDPILPGQKGQVTLKFDSSNFDGLVSKQAEVYANVQNSPILITFSADIQPK